MSADLLSSVASAFLSEYRQVKQTRLNKYFKQAIEDANQKIRDLETGKSYEIISLIERVIRVAESDAREYKLAVLSSCMRDAVADKISLDWADTLVSINENLLPRHCWLLRKIVELRPVASPTSGLLSWRRGITYQVLAGQAKNVAPDSEDLLWVTVNQCLQLGLLSSKMQYDRSYRDKEIADFGSSEIRFDEGTSNHLTQQIFELTPLGYDVCERLLTGNYQL